MKIVFIILLLFGIIGSFLPSIRSNHWTIRLWDYPRKQLLVFQVFIFVLGMFILQDKNQFDKIIFCCSGLSILSLFYRIFPYTRFYTTQLKKSKKEENSISILVSNVEMQNTNYQKLVDCIEKKDPDLVLLLETDDKWRKGMISIEANYPHLKHLPKNNTYGVLVYSKIKLEEARYEYLINEEIPSFHAVLTIGGTKIRFYGLHPEPPFPTQSKDTTERDAEILMVGKQIKDKKQPTIVAGDLNDVAWSYTTRLFQKISGMLDPRIGRGFFSTFHASYFWARWPLDHIFVSDHFQLNKMERLDNVGSDHFPIYIKLILDATSENENVGSVSEGELEIIEQKIEDGK